MSLSERPTWRSKNVIKSAPEVTFWGGQRFYDRYNIDSQDYFFLDSSGIGAGVYNIDLGIGSLACRLFRIGIRSGTGALFGATIVSFNDFNLQVNGGEGNFYRHTFDVRLGDIDFLGGKLKLVRDWLLSTRRRLQYRLCQWHYRRGHVENSGGVGGGFVHQWDLPPSWGKLSFVQIAALYGWGLVEFDPSVVDLGKLNNALPFFAGARKQEPGDRTSNNVNPYNNSQRARANIYWVWNPTDNFSLGTWATYQFDDQGFTSYQVNANGSFPAHRPLRISLLPALGLITGFGVPLQFKVIRLRYLSNNRVTGDAGSAAAAPSAREARWVSLRSPRPSNQEAAFSPVLSCAPSRPSPSGLTSSRDPLVVQPTPTKTTDLSLVSKLKHGFKRGNAICLT